MSMEAEALKRKLEDFPWLWSVARVWNPSESTVQVVSADNGLAPRIKLAAFENRDFHVKGAWNDGNKQFVLNFNAGDDVPAGIIHVVLRRLEDFPGAVVQYLAIGRDARVVIHELPDTIDFVALLKKEVEQERAYNL